MYLIQHLYLWIDQATSFGNIAFFGAICTEEPNLCFIKLK